MQEPACFGINLAFQSASVTLIIWSSLVKIHSLFQKITNRKEA